jgi:hypothetical protein
MLGFPHSHIGKIAIPGIDRERIVDSHDLANIAKNIDTVMKFHSSKNAP